MFGIGTTELIIILVVALLVLGPKKLPEIAKSLGKGVAEFRRMSSDMQRTIETEANRADEEREKEKIKKELFPEGTEKPIDPAPAAQTTVEAGVTVEPVKVLPTVAQTSGTQTVESQVDEKKA